MAQNEGLSGREIAAFGAGMMLSLIASRIAPPFASRAIGTLRGRAGADPFEVLAADHRRMLGLFSLIERTDDSATARRTALLFQLKRMLAAHALAEEDVVYPMLRDDARLQSEVLELYNEHAGMKIRLFELERAPKDGRRWMTLLRDLRKLVEDHAGDEEQRQFPRLRAKLDERQTANLLGRVQREKAFLL